MSAASYDLDVKRRIRSNAAEKFLAAGLPHRRIEDWKYSDLKVVLGDRGLSKKTASWRIVDLPEGVDLFDLSESVWPDWVYYTIGSLNAGTMSAASLALSRGGVALRVESLNKQPVNLEVFGEGNLRLWIMLEPGASLTLRELQTTESQINVGLECGLGHYARLTHVRSSPKQDDAVRVEDISVSVGAGAVYRAHFVDFGAKLSRTELHIALEGEGAQAHLSGVSVVGEGRHADVTTRITHASGNALSTQLFKIIAGGKSRGVYQGKVSVAEGANGTDSRQTAKGLLLGERAEIDLKPELEILADDVKCAHGAAVGDLDPESLFYLRSRGLPESEARALLMQAFLEDAVVEIDDESIRADVWSRVEAALAELSG